MKRRAKSRPGPAFEPCANCNQTGFVVVLEQRNDVYVPMVDRCTCWKVHQARLADLERAQQGEK